MARATESVLPSRPRLLAGRKTRDLAWRGVAFLLLCLLAVPFLAPVAWMVLTSLKTVDQTQLFPPEWIPHPFVWSNYPDSLTAVADLWKYFLNTIYYSGFCLIGELLSSSLVAYGFAKFRGPGRGVLFLVMISTLLIPYPVVMVPQYVLFARLGWVNTYLPLIVPSFFASPFLVFLLRQFMQGISTEIIEAARLDGAGPLRIYARIILPLTKLALLAGGILSFSGHWNDYLGPLLYINSADLFPLQLGLATFVAYRGMTHWELLMAASVMAVLPIVILFFFAQRSFLQGIVITGIK